MNYTGSNPSTFLTLDEGKSVVQEFNAKYLRTHGIGFGLGFIPQKGIVVQISAKDNVSDALIGSIKKELAVEALEKHNKNLSDDAVSVDYVVTSRFL